MKIKKIIKKIPEGIFFIIGDFIEDHKLVIKTRSY